MKRIVFSDIDGTLLTNDREVLPSTLKAINSLNKQDIPFIIISARSPSGIYPILDKHHLSCPIVSYSGALFLDENKKVIFHEGMNKIVAKEVIEFIEKERFDCSWNIFSFDNWVVKDRNDPRIIREENAVKAKSIEGSISDIKEDEIHKILCICNINKTEEIENKLQKMFPFLSIVKSSPILLEIMEAGITKASAIHKVCELLNTDISNAIALYRPGPAVNIPSFVVRKKGYEKIDYITPLFTDILKDTYGIIVYQEQIMQIARVFANFSLSKADLLRRAMSKKKIEILKTLEEEFINGGIANGYTYETGKKVYDLILKFANYGFNKSHSVAYSLVAYKMAYLKGFVCILGILSYCN